LGPMYVSVGVGGYIATLNLPASPTIGCAFVLIDNTSGKTGFGYLYGSQAIRTDYGQNTPAGTAYSLTTSNHFAGRMIFIVFDGSTWCLAYTYAPYGS
jgi:hypothetical protein